MIENEEQSWTERDAAAERLEQLAAEGDVHAQYILGLLYRDGGLRIPDVEKARYWLEQAAKTRAPCFPICIGSAIFL